MKNFREVKWHLEKHMQLGGSYLKFSVLLLDCGERENIMLLDHVKRKKMKNNDSI